MSSRSVSPSLLAIFNYLIQSDAEFAAQAAQRFGIDGNSWQQAGRVDAGLLSELMQLAWERDQDRDCALQLSHQMPLNALGSLGLYLVSASGLRELLTDLHRYWPTIQPTPAHLEVRIDEQRVALGLRIQGEWTLPRLLLLEVSLHCLIRLLRSSFGPALQPTHIAYPELPFGIPGAWFGLLGVDARVEGKVLSLNLPLRWLDATPLSANAALRNSIRPNLDAELRQVREESGWAQRVHARISAESDLSTLDLGSLAKSLELSADQLNQRLRAEHSDFYRVLDAVRRERALERLLSAELDSEALARQLGYAERADFEIQFRRWFQTTPTALRSDALAAGIDARSGAAARFDTLPPAPQTTRSLVALRYLEDASLDAIVAAVEPDPALSAKVMGAASSAFYGARKVRDLQDAIGRVIGLNELIRIATVLAARSTLQPRDCPQFDLLAFWSRSLAVGYAAADLLQMADPALDIENTRLLGLFHDLGLQVLAHHAGPRLSQMVQSIDDDASETSIRNAELRHLGTTRHITGSILLAHWGLPPETVRALRQMDHCILDPHADIELEIRLIVLLSRYFRRRYLSQSVDADALAILALFALHELPLPIDADSLMAQLDEVLETRRMQAEELLQD